MPRKAKQKEAVTPANVFFCCDQEFTPEQVIEHLKEIHFVAPGTVGQRRMNTHVDGKDFYMSSYTWQFGDLTLTQSVSQPRAKDDPMRFDE